MEAEIKKDTGYNFDINTTYLEEKDYEKSETLYRKQFLQVFNIEKYDFIEINKIIPIVYEIIKNENFFEELFTTVRENTKLPFEIKKQDLIILLFQYDYFHNFHSLLQCLYKDQEHSHVKNELLNKIKVKHKTNK